MKNHIWQDGQLLQTNKKWSALKQRQRAWIQEMTAKEHAAYVDKHGKLPISKSKETVLDKVHDHINERGIWIPYGEFKAHVSVMIDKLNRNNPLFNAPAKKEPKPNKSNVPTAGIENFSENVQTEVKEKLTQLIREYISQKNCMPPDIIRSQHINVILNGFNAEQWKPYEKRMTRSKILRKIYNELKVNLMKQKE